MLLLPGSLWPSLLLRSSLSCVPLLPTGISATPASDWCQRSSVNLSVEGLWDTVPPLESPWGQGAEEATQTQDEVGG